MTYHAPLFISHGSPEMILRDTSARRHLINLGAELPKPAAILSISAHFETHRPTVVADPSPETMYDFRGFDESLYRMVYPAPGNPGLAMQIADCLRAAGHDVDIAEKRAFDHGTWTPLRLMFPHADVPVVQLSVQPDRDPAHHLAIGRVLAPFREQDVLILASGSISHNLRELFAMARDPHFIGPPPDWIIAFTEWMAERSGEGDIEALCDYRREAPFAERNHPTDEHLLPFFVALGAAEDAAKGHRIHESYDVKVLPMDCYRFAA